MIGSNIIKFTHVNIKPKVKDKTYFTLDTYTNNIIAYIYDKKIKHVLYSNALLLNIDSCDDGDDMSELEQINFFRNNAIHNIKLFKKYTGTTEYYLRYKSENINLKLDLYNHDEYIKKIGVRITGNVHITGAIMHRLDATTCKNGMLKKDIETMIEQYSYRVVEINKKHTSEINAIYLKLDKQVSESITEKEKLELEIKTLNSRILNQSTRTEERVKKIKDLQEENKKLTNGIVQVTKVNENKSYGECGVCAVDSTLVSVECCVNKCCVKCIIKLTIKDHKFKCPYCRRETM